MTSAKVLTAQRKPAGQIVGSDELKFRLSPIVPNGFYEVMARSNSPGTHWIDLAAVLRGSNQSVTVSRQPEGKALKVADLPRWTLIAPVGCDPDGDGDGWSNAEEFSLRTDPQEANRVAPAIDLNHPSFMTLMRALAAQSGADSLFDSKLKSERRVRVLVALGSFGLVWLRLDARSENEPGKSEVRREAHMRFPKQAWETAGGNWKPMSRCLTGVVPRSIRLLPAMPHGYWWKFLVR